MNRTTFGKRPVSRLLGAGLVAIVVACTTPAVVAAADAYSPRPTDEVRNDVVQWVARRGIKDEQTLARIAKLWADSSASSAGRECFDRLIESFCIADPAARQFVESCNPAATAKTSAKSDFLSREEADEFYVIHLRLYYARSLTLRSMYDEALDVFARIDPARVVDPATCLFYQAVCQHQLLMKKEGLETLDKLLHKTQGVAESYSRVAALMQAELEPIDEHSLASVSRKMKDSERRLDLGRGGQRVQKVQSEIVETLDELIKKAEQQANSQSQSSEGDSNSNRSNSPADDSRIKGSTAPGNVDKKNLKKQGSWGSLPSKDHETRAQNLLSRDFPSNYRQAVEEYLKKMANRPASK